MWETLSNLLAPGPARATLGLRLVLALVILVIALVRWLLGGME